MTACKRYSDNALRGAATPRTATRRIALGPARTYDGKTAAIGSHSRSGEAGAKDHRRDCARDRIFGHDCQADRQRPSDEISDQPIDATGRRGLHSPPRLHRQSQRPQSEAAADRYDRPRRSGDRQRLLRPADGAIGAPVPQPWPGAADGVDRRGSQAGGHRRAQPMGARRRRHDHRALPAARLWPGRRPKGARLDRHRRSPLRAHALPDHRQRQLRRLPGADARGSSRGRRPHRLPLRQSRLAEHRRPHSRLFDRLP